MQSHRRWREIANLAANSVVRPPIVILDLADFENGKGNLPDINDKSWKASSVKVFKELSLEEKEKKRKLVKSQSCSIQSLGSYIVEACCSILFVFFNIAQ